MPGGIAPGDRRRVRWSRRKDNAKGGHLGPAYEPIREREPAYPVPRGTLGHGDVWISVSCWDCYATSLVAKGASLAAAAALLEVHGWRWELGEGPLCEACSTRPQT